MTSDALETYLSRLGRELKTHGFSDARMVEEAREHLVDAIEEGLNRGLSIDAAERSAIVRFGTPETVAAHFVEEKHRMTRIRFMLTRGRESVSCTLRRSAFWTVLVLVVVAVGVWNFSTHLDPRSKPMPFSDFMRDVEAGKIERVTITGQEVSGVYRADKETFHTYAPAQYAAHGLANKLDAQGILVRR